MTIPEEHQWIREGALAWYDCHDGHRPPYPAIVLGNPYLLGEHTWCVRLYVDSYEYAEMKGGRWAIPDPACARLTQREVSA